MAHFLDLTPYVYGPSCASAEERVVNVGWLAEADNFRRGKFGGRLLEKLLRLCNRQVNITRGLHRCPFCGKSPIRIPFGENEILLGSAEIRVWGSDGIVFAAPTLIYHYIRDHDYMPPDEFVNALAVL